MSSGQMLLAMGALTLLSLTMLSVNSALVGFEQQTMEGAFQLAATSLGQSLLEEAMRKGFDEVVLSDPPSSLPSLFTSVESLGPETGESYSDFDDVDDFNGYSRSDTTEAGMTYTLDAVVEYVNGSSPGGVASSSPTFFKRLRVKVSSEYLSSDTEVYALVCYWGE